MKMILVLFVSICAIATAVASTPYYWHPQVAKAYSRTNLVNNDQERCQAEANYMAANRICGHVWGTIGNFEGIGFGNSPNCNTCTPSSNMRLTGDASAQDSNGRWYRVRSWR